MGLALGELTFGKVTKYPCAVGELGFKAFGGYSASKAVALCNLYVSLRLLRQKELEEEKLNFAKINAIEVKTATDVAAI